MGLLDDAIREHLELKRQHGASDEEVAQEEAEALGPARRDFPQPAAAEESESAELHGAEEETVIDEPPPPEPEAVREPEEAVEPDPDTRNPTPDTQPPDTQPPDTPEAEHKGTDEDMLEETPEFLQDAPEHDRLWFEQKPPRDFDFE